MVLFELNSEIRIYISPMEIISNTHQYFMKIDLCVFLQMGKYRTEISLLVQVKFNNRQFKLLGNNFQ